MMTHMNTQYTSLFTCRHMKESHTVILALLASPTPAPYLDVHGLLATDPRVIGTSTYM